MKKLVGMVKKNVGKILAVLASTMFCVGQVFAAGTAITSDSLMNGNNATDSFKGVIGFIGTWTTYLGAAIAFFGAVQLAMGFRSDDAEGKNKGMRSMISGFIVLAIGIAASTFMNMAG